jgi:N-acyl-D-amino-acid deacylase
VTDPSPPSAGSGTPAGVVAATIELSTRQLTLLRGRTAAVSAIVRDSQGRFISNARLQWSTTGPETAAVDSAGVVRGLAVGRAAIRVASGPVVDSVAVTVDRVPAAAVAFAGAWLRTDTLFVGDSIRLEASARDLDGAAITDVPVRWDVSDSASARLSPSHLVATRPGTISVTAQVDTARVSRALRFILIPVARVTQSPARAVILTGDTVPLTVRTYAGDGTELAGRAVRWLSADPQVAEVTADGRVLPRRAGVVRISATVEGVSANDAELTIHTGGGWRAEGATAYDSLIPPLMAKWGIPGGVVGVVREGRLALLRTYGYADSAARRVMDADALFRIASISKPITSAAILKLVEQGRLSLDDRAVTRLPELDPGVSGDVRIRDVTIRQLLQHTAGWDRDLSGDPMLLPIGAARAVGAPAPASAATVVAYMRTRPLDFAPGARYAYSNFGYAVLGLIVERVTGQAYDAFVRQSVLQPAGVTRMVLGRTRAAERALEEVRYYDPLTGPSIFPGGGMVPAPDGSFYLEAMAAHGGWVSSAADLLRFAGAVDGRPTRPDILSPTSIEQMSARPAVSTWRESAYWYGLGWAVRPAGADANWWHAGSLPGTTTLLVRASDGTTWVALFNGRGWSATTSFDAELDGVLWTAFSRVARWPSTDAFPRAR